MEDQAIEQFRIEIRRFGRPGMAENYHLECARALSTVLGRALTPSVQFTPSAFPCQASSLQKRFSRTRTLNHCLGRAARLHTVMSVLGRTACGLVISHKRP